MRRSGHVEAGSAGASLVALVGLAALGVLLSGCDSGPGGSEQPNGISPDPVAEQTVEPATPPSPRAPSSTTASPRAPETDGANSDAELEVPETGEPPSLEGLRSDDELTVARTMARYTAWMSEHPNVDPDAWSKIIDSELNRDYEALHNLTSHYRRNGLWWTGGDSRVVDVEVLDSRGLNTRVVRIHYRRDDTAKLVDSQGHVHDKNLPRQWWSEEVWTRDGEDAKWLATDLGPSGDVEE